MAVEVCLVSPINGMDLGRAYLPVNGDGGLPSTSDLQKTLASMCREASRLQPIYSWQQLDFTVVLPDNEFQSGTIDANGNVVRFLP